MTSSDLTPEHPAHSGHEFGGAYARSAALASGDPDWMNAKGGVPDAHLSDATGTAGVSVPGNHDELLDEAADQFETGENHQSDIVGRKLIAAVRAEQSARQAAERRIDAAYKALTRPVPNGANRTAALLTTPIASKKPRLTLDNFDRTPAVQPYSLAESKEPDHE